MDDAALVYDAVFNKLYSNILGVKQENQADAEHAINLIIDLCDNIHIASVLLKNKYLGWKEGLGNPPEEHKKIAKEIQYNTLFGRVLSFSALPAENSIYYE